jgi:hypothetical protein
MSTISEAYRRNECNTWHDDYDEARECCDPQIRNGYKCDGCGEYHTLKENAENCCPSVEYTCPKCQIEYGTIDEAEECCGCHIEEADVRIPPAVLELYGQQRLPI